MCGRFVALTDPDGLARFLVVDDRVAADRAPSYNVAPTHPVYAAVEEAARRTLVTLRWGLLPPWADDPAAGPPMINARAETAARKPAFREAFAHRRCLIPADGYYEWRLGPGGSKVPHYVHAPDGRPLALAGVWSSWRGQGPSPATLRTCAIVTTAANAPLSALHHRTPAVLPRRAWDEWLDPGHPDPPALTRLLRPVPDDALVFHAVGQEVNSPRFDHPGLIEPVAEQLRLM